MRWVLGGTVACLLVGSTGLASAQTREVGTATISGRVIAAQGEGPLARAEVYLQDRDGDRLVLTDDQGRYAFTDLPARSYTLTAGRSGYVSIHYGQQRREDPFEPIALSAGQAREHLDFALSRGATIEATVIDEHGDPVEGLSVLALRQRPPREDRLDQIVPDSRPSPSQSSAITDQRGRARIYDLSPGDYYVIATTLDRIVLDSPPMVERRQQLLAGYKPAFYPGTADSDEARAVRLTAGQDVDIQIAIAPKAVDTAAPGPAPAPSAAPLGRGRITGRVLDADGAGPLVRAAVTLNGAPALQSNGMPLWDRIERTTFTDGEGRFAFADLPDSHYILNASQRGYLTRGYGQRPNQIPQLPIWITNGGTVDHVDIALLKAGALTVRITDEFGNPRAGVQVTVLQRRRDRGESRLLPVQNVPTLWSSLLDTSFATDDRGEARAHDLPAGDYWVGAWFCDQNCQLMEAPETQHRTLHNMPHDQPLIYAKTYYPGTASAAFAQPIAISAGQELSVSFALMPVRTARLSGVVLGADGKRTHGQFVDLKATGDGNFERTERASVNDGLFSFSRVAPGDYVIETPDEEDRPASEEFGTLTVAVDSVNLADLVLKTAPPGAWHGRIVFDTGAAPDDLKPAEINGAVYSPGTMHISPLELAEDWSFTAAGIRGPSMLGIAGAPKGWRLARVTLNGRDVTKVPLTEARDVEVVLSRGSTVTGTVVDSQGGLVLACPVLIFSEADLSDPDNQVIETGNSGVEGQFRIQPLLPGRYFALALPKGFRDTADNDESLADLERQATHFTIPEGEPVALSLTLTMADQP